MSDKDASIHVSTAATHYIGLSMADMEALVRGRDLEIERLTRKCERHAQVAVDVYERLNVVMEETNRLRNKLGDE